MRGNVVMRTDLSLEKGLEGGIFANSLLYKERERERERI